MADIRYLIEVDDQGAVKAVKDWDKSLDDVAKTSGKTETATKSLWSQVALGEFAYGVAKKAGQFFVDFLKDSVTEAANAEKQDKSLAAALEITGRPVKTLTEHFKAFAEEMQKATTFEDDQVKQAQTLLIQLTNLDRDGLDKATKGAIGLASVMGMDLNSATMVIEKAVNGNAGALSRYGIQIDGTQSKEKIRAEVLEKLAPLYARATADTETYSGKLAQLKNRYSDIQESAGNALIKSLRPFMDAVSDPATMKAVETLTTKAMTLIGKIAEGYGYLAQMIAYSVSAQKDEATAVLESSAKIATSYIARREALEKYGASYKDIAAGIQDFSRDAQGAIIDEGTAFEKLLQAVKNGDPYYKSLKGAVDQFVASQREAATAEGKIQAALAKTKPLLEGDTKGTNTFTDSVKKAIVPLKTYADILGDMPGEHKRHTQAIYEVIPGLDALGKADDKVAMKFDKNQQKISSSLDEFVDKVNDAYQQYGAAASSAFGFVDQLVNQSYDNKSVRLENDYKKQLEYINNSKMSETEKAVALEALDKEYEGKRRALAAAQAQSQKAMSAANALISTFEAAAKAYTAGPIIGPILAAIIMALGLGLVAKIASAPIPLAKGAIFRQPTLLAGANGRDYQVAEAGEPEIVASPSNIRKAVGLDKGDRGGRGRPITLVIHNYIAGQKVQEQIIKIVEDASQTGKLRLSGKSVT